MRTSWILVAALVAASPGAARADACLDALQAPTPDHAAMEGCLASRPALILSGGGSVTLPGGWSVFAAADAPLPARLWLSARARWLGAGVGLTDLMAGFRITGSYDRRLVWWTDSQVDATTVLNKGRASVVRTDWVIAAGAKAVFDGGVDVGKTYALGIQRHSASGFGTHKRIELYGVLRGSKLGATAVWHNAIPPVPWLVFGMEAGFVPYESGDEMPVEDHAIYWGMIDLGVSYELGGGS